MSCRCRPALYLLAVVLTLALSLVATGASVAQEAEPAASSASTVDPALIGPAAPAAIVPGGPGFYSQTALAFRPYPNQATPFTFGGRTLYNPGTETHYYEAAVSLPHGARVTKFVVWYTDNHASLNVWAALARAALDDTAVAQIGYVASTDAAPGVRFLQDTTITTPVVDNQSYMYWVEVGLPQANAAGVLSFRIDYDFPTFLPLTLKK